MPEVDRDVTELRKQPGNCLPTALQQPSFWLEGRHYDWRALIGERLPRRVARGNVLYDEGAPVDEVFVLAQGRVRLVTYSAEGRERHVLVVGPGGLVGDAGIFAPGRHLTSAVVSADATVHPVARQLLLSTLHTDAAVLRQVLEFADRRLQSMLQHHALLSAGPALQRVGMALLGLAQVYGTAHAQGLRIQMHFTQSEVASICGISRMSVSTAFGALADMGLLLREQAFVVITDLVALHAATHPSR
jgi:CRP/FNR family cyclic AMP-dependent transcriptional regulator